MPIFLFLTQYPRGGSIMLLSLTICPKREGDIP